MQQELTPFLAYFIGLMAADGHIVNYKNCSINQSGQDGMSLLEQIRDELKLNKKIYVTYPKGGLPSYRYYINDQNLISLLKEYNVVERKSLIYTLPEYFPIKYLQYFLRGYVDGDGSIGYYWAGKTNIFVISFVGTKEFIDRCIELLPFKSIPRKLRAKNCYELRFYGRKGLSLYKWLYLDTKNDIKIISAKQKKYAEYLKVVQPAKYDKYDPLREQFFQLRKENFSAMEISRKLELPFQTIYKWIKKYEN